MTPRFSVSDFLAVVNQSLEMAFGAVEIEGEVASFKVNHQKYVFFDLKDIDGAVGCFMTVWQLRTPIEDGMKVVVRAVPKVTNWGKFSLTVQEVHPLGEGNLRRSQELLKQKLDKEGLFDESRKRSLPARPTRVAVISSTQAAGYADFMKISAERWGGVKFQVANVMVQGDKAPDQIIKALDFFEQLLDLPEVIVLTRGGGSADDLATFNDEHLVRKIASCRVPVLTGIGHEIDESLADLAADVRAATPSNAAELLFSDKQEEIRSIHARLGGVSHTVEKEIRDRLSAIHLGENGAIDIWRRHVEDALASVLSRSRLIGEYDPDVVFRRGYALVEGEKVINSVVTITTVNEIMKARIEEYEKRHDN